MAERFQSRLRVACVRYTMMTQSKAFGASSKWPRRPVSNLLVSNWLMGEVHAA